MTKQQPRYDQLNTKSQTNFLIFFGGGAYLIKKLNYVACYAYVYKLDMLHRCYYSHIVNKVSVVRVRAKYVTSATKQGEGMCGKNGLVGTRC